MGIIDPVSGRSDKYPGFARTLVLRFLRTRRTSVKIKLLTAVLIPVVIAGVLIGFLLLGGIGFLEQPTIQTPQGIGITDITNREIPGNISFSDAIISANSYFYLSNDTKTTPSIRYIKGQGVDLNGLASEWIIGMRVNNQNYFFEYGPYGESTRIWNGDLPEKEIKTDNIISPADLFKFQKSRVSGVGSNPTNIQYGIEIRDGYYYISSESGITPKTFMFNAYSGEFVSGSE